MKKGIRFFCIILCIICLFCGCIAPTGGDRYSSGNYEITNWRLTDGTTIKGIDNISSKGIKVTFAKTETDVDGGLSAEVGNSIKDNPYVSFEFSSNSPLFIRVECVLLNASNATDTLNVSATILVQEEKTRYTSVLNVFGEEYQVLKSVEIYPSYGTDVGSGELCIHTVDISDTFASGSSIVTFNKENKPVIDEETGNNGNTGNNQGSNTGNNGGTSVQNPTYLWEKYNDYFPIGYAIGAENIDRYKGTLDKHFNSFTCENEMKLYVIAPNSSTQANYAPADNMLNYVRSQGKICRGHTLIWYNGAPDWLTSIRDKATLLRAIEEYVTRVVQHFGDKVYCWDVVNEVVGDDNQYRSTFYDVAGIDFIKTAFRAARKANPNIKLFYNDYNMDKPQKRAKVMEMLRELIRDGVPIDGVGMQAHYDLKYTTVAGVENAIRDFASLGLEVQITEFDIKNYGNTGEAAQAQLYGDLFALFRRYKDTVTGVTFWNVADDYSWLDGNMFSHFGTGKAYPTLFDERHNKKSAFDKVFNF